MNVYDFEWFFGLLESVGYVWVVDGVEVDVVIINICVVCDNVVGKLYGMFGYFVVVKCCKEGMQIVVGGCLVQMDKQVVFDKVFWVDVVFGMYNMGFLFGLFECVCYNGDVEFEIFEFFEVFFLIFLIKCDFVYSGWVLIFVGCNNICMFCIVLSLWGKEKDCCFGDILNEICFFVEDGVIEVILFGQNVNFYGVEFGDWQVFGKLLCVVGEIEGFEWICFISLYFVVFMDDVIDVMVEMFSVMLQLYMLLQLGSDCILKVMWWFYWSECFFGIFECVCVCILNVVIMIDIIVGFFGEIEEDFEDMMCVVEQVCFFGVFIFQYLICEGIFVVMMENQVLKDVVQV